MRYIVITREVWTQGYEVEASSREEAVEQVSSQANGVETVDGLFEFSHTLDRDTWTVEPDNDDVADNAALHRIESSACDH